MRPSASQGQLLMPFSGLNTASDDFLFGAADQAMISIVIEAN
jgi:hypothetical protein